MKVESQPRKAPETIHPVSESTQNQHLLKTLLQRTICSLKGSIFIGFINRVLFSSCYQRVYEVGFRPRPCPKLADRILGIGILLLTRLDFGD
ncbi:unnamed protein product [Coffea canephora]|uniref:Uncharacterized protein n=1 Tax=Coffea canephora TaxID=49390 RepID=A0A068TTR0_COFCA|nr:unnamed protein product [Coffea canephora]